MLIYFLFILGFIFAIKGAGLLVDGAAVLARKMKVSEMVIGLTIVAFGTSVPELVVNIVSNFKGAADLALGNVLGANIANILLVIGLAALIAPIKIVKTHSNRNTFFVLAAVVLLFLLLNDFFVQRVGAVFLGRFDGLILILCFVLFVYYILGAKRKNREEPNLFARKDLGLVSVSAMIVIGLIGLGLGGEWIVGGGVKIARVAGLSEKVIGLTIISFGTILPELFASLYAAVKGKADIAVGNVIGSVIFNMAFILGLSAMIKPIAFNSAFNIDIGVCFLAVILLYYFSRLGRKTDHIEKWEGIGLFSAYLVYIVFLVWRG